MAALIEIETSNRRLRYLRSNRSSELLDPSSDISGSNNSGSNASIALRDEIFDHAMNIFVKFPLDELCNVSMPYIYIYIIYYFV